MLATQYFFIMEARIVYLNLVCESRPEFLRRSVQTQSLFYGIIILGILHTAERSADVFIPDNNSIYWRAFHGIQASIVLLVNLSVIIEWGLLYRFFFNKKQAMQRRPKMMGPSCES